MATTIFLVRHGQTEANVAGYYMGWSNEDLDGSGRVQARQLSYRLARLPINSIYTSPLRRAYSTAEAVAEPHKLEVETLEDLIEIRLGEWQGMHRDEIKQRWLELWRKSRRDPSELILPGGESYREVTRRAVQALRKAAADNAGKQAVMVTHEAIIRVIVAQILEVSNSIYHRLQIDNGSIAVVRTGKRPQLVRLNDISHQEDGFGIEARGGRL